MFEKLLVKMEGGEAEVHLFSASLIHVIPDGLNGRFPKNRLLFRAIRGYWLCYVIYRDELISYAFFKKNYLLKYRFMHRKDVLINTYDVSPQYRSHRLGAKMLNIALSSDRFEWRKAFAVVNKNNVPSIRTLQKIGFTLIGYEKKSDWSYHISLKPTELLVFCKERS